jgi:hypothetical protein
MIERRTRWKEGEGSGTTQGGTSYAYHDKRNEKGVLWPERTARAVLVHRGVEG